MRRVSKADIERNVPQRKSVVQTMKGDVEQILEERNANQDAHGNAEESQRISSRLRAVGDRTHRERVKHLKGRKEEMSEEVTKSSERLCWMMNRLSVSRGQDEVST